MSIWRKSEGGCLCKSNQEKEGKILLHVSKIIHFIFIFPIHFKLYDAPTSTSHISGKQYRCVDHNQLLIIYGLLN